jgi:hypothetical protein
MPASHMGIMASSTKGCSNREVQIIFFGKKIMDGESSSTKEGKCPRLDAAIQVN